MAAKKEKNGTPSPVGNDDSKNHGIKIPPILLVLILSFGLSFVRARLKDWGILAGRNNAVGGERPQEKVPIDLLSSSSSANAMGTQVLSDFLQDADVLAKLNDTHLWKDCTELNEDAMLWMDYGAAPKNIWEELAVKIWKSHPVIQQQLQEEEGAATFAGYEYWCNMLRPEIPLNWHVDKDEILLEESENTQLKTPYMGSVLYGYPHQFTGGYLEVFPSTPDKIPDPDHYADLADHVERIQARYNRLVFLNVSEWHRVTPLTSGTRYTLAVNLWKEKPRLSSVSKEPSDGKIVSNNAESDRPDL